MKDDTVISEKVKCKIERFSQMVTQGLSKHKKRFISQMLFGIQASRDVNPELVSGIARSLNEEIKLTKTENRRLEDVRVRENIS